MTAGNARLRLPLLRPDRAYLVDGRRQTAGPRGRTRKEEQECGRFARMGGDASKYLVIMDGRESGQY